MEVVHEEVMRLLADIGSASEYGFRTISEAYLRLKGEAGFGRYSEEYADEYAALGAAIEKRNGGVARANAVISAATDLMESLEGRIVDKADVEDVALQLRALDAWRSEYASLVAWRLEDVERCRKRISDAYDEMKERFSLVSAINKATDYGTLYDLIQRLLTRYSTYVECRRIDSSRIVSESRVKSAITKPGWFSSETLYEFVGVIKVCPENATDVVPVLTKTVNAKAEIFCVGMHSRKLTPVVKKIFERTKNGGFRKVHGMDYDKCQGIGLFIRKNSSWELGSRNPEHAHWLASGKPGVWIVEPGYTKTSVFAGELSEVKWCPNKIYKVGTRRYRTGRAEGCWQYLGACHACSGFGTRQCPSCCGRRITWNDVDSADAKLFVESLIAEKVKEGM